MCPGTGTETLPTATIGYLEAKAGKTTYYLAVPRASGAFACGHNRAIKRNRVVIIGQGDATEAEIEAADTVPRTLAQSDSVMKGSFESTKTRGAVHYEYKISWSVSRGQPQP